LAGRCSWRRLHHQPWSNEWSEERHHNITDDHPLSIMASGWSSRSLIIQSIHKWTRTYSFSLVRLSIVLLYFTTDNIIWARFSVRDSSCWLWDCSHTGSGWFLLSCTLMSGEATAASSLLFGRFVNSSSSLLMH
jgi:hypothetical protein